MKWNHYTCEQCGRVTISRDDDEGVTPFMVRCRASRGCEGAAISGMYRGSQDEMQVPHIIWWKPKTDVELEDAIRDYTYSVRAQMREHVRKGGLLPKDGPARPV